MIKLVTLSLCAMVANIPASTAGQKPMNTKKLQWVRGLLNAHWEYPGFLPARRSGLTYMGFQFEEEKWQQVYIKPVADAMIHHPDETKCFRVIGQGYLAPRRPTIMQNWEGSQFIFVKIKKLELTSEVECASHMKTNDR
jgi:hypothetical protein